MNTEKEKGITILSLVITVVVLLIISGIGIGFGTNAIKSAEDSKLTSELMMVQHAILEQYAKYRTTKDNSFLLGNKIEKSQVENFANQMEINLAIIPQNYTNADYYQLDNASLTQLGIQNSSDEYIINYISGEVLNITKMKTSSGAPLYVKAKSFDDQ